MRALLRPANLFIVATYLLLSAVPFVPLLFSGQSVAEPWGVLFLEATLWMAVWVAFKRPAWFHVFLLPAFLSLPVELYLRAFYGQGISTHHLGIIAETSPKEALEFLGSKIWLLALILILIVAWWAWTWVLAWRTRDLDWRGKSRAAGLALVLLVGGAWWYGA